MKLKNLALLGLVAVCVSVVAGCKGGLREDPILRLSAEEALAEGKQLMESEKFTRAVPYLEHAFEVAPNSTTGREALLLAADAYFKNGGTANFVKAEAKYRDFLNRFPTSERADYVQMQIANCLAEQMLKPDRDQRATYKALEAFESVLQLYPTSGYGEEVEARIVDLRNNLAEHEYRVGRYNFRRRFYAPAIRRLEGIVEDYPNFNEMDKVLFMLGRSYHKNDRPEDAAATFEKLRSEYPDSRYIQRIPKQKVRT